MELSLALLTYKAKTYHIIHSRVYPSSAFGGGGELSNSSSIGVAVYGYPVISLGVGFHMPFISMVTMFEFLV